MKTKIFDCVEMKHKGAEKIRKELGGYNLKQELEYWKHQTGLLKKEQEYLKETHSSRRHSKDLSFLPFHEF